MADVVRLIAAVLGFLSSVVNAVLLKRQKEQTLYYRVQKFKRLPSSEQIVLI
jgi:hypothetical protein